MFTSKSIVSLEFVREKLLILNGNVGMYIRVQGIQTFIMPEIRFNCILIKYGVHLVFKLLTWFWNWGLLFWTKTLLWDNWDFTQINPDCILLRLHDCCYISPSNTIVTFYFHLSVLEKNHWTDFAKLDSFVFPLLSVRPEHCKILYNISSRFA